MRKFLVGLVTVLAVIGLYAGVASAGSRNDTDFNCDGVETNVVYSSWAWNGYGYSYNYNVTATGYHQTGGGCVYGSQWSDSTVNMAVSLQRLTYGGWYACTYQSGTSYQGSLTVATIQPAGTGVCSTPSWPAGWQRLIISATVYHSGAGVTVNDTYVSNS